MTDIMTAIRWQRWRDGWMNNGRVWGEGDGHFHSWNTWNEILIGRFTAFSHNWASRDTAHVRQVQLKEVDRKERSCWNGIALQKLKKKVKQYALRNDKDKGWIWNSILECSPIRVKKKFVSMLFWTFKIVAHCHMTSVCLSCCHRTHYMHVSFSKRCLAIPKN